MPLPIKAIPNRVGQDHPVLMPVYLTVNVPDGASVLVNGRQTTSTGNRRTYVSRGVTAGNRYKYEIQAKMDQDGTPRIENRVVYARAGEHPEVQFPLVDTENEKTQLVDEPPANEAEKTTLRIHVPADAKVFLAGQATKSTGPVRVFQTSRLADGQRWEGYTIRAEVDRDGITVSQERTIKLQSGQGGRCHHRLPYYATR